VVLAGGGGGSGAFAFEGPGNGGDGGEVGAAGADGTGTVDFEPVYNGGGGGGGGGYFGGGGGGGVITSGSEAGGGGGGSSDGPAGAVFESGFNDGDGAVVITYDPADQPAGCGQVPTTETTTPAAQPAVVTPRFTG